MRENSFLLHQAQQDIYTDQLIDLSSSQYNIGGYLKLIGPLDLQKLHQAVASAPTIFDTFKIRFDIHEPTPVCYFDDACLAFPMGDMDFSNHSNPAEEAITWMQERFNTAFVLEKNNPLFEQCLIKISNNEHWFFGKYHHLMADGYGFVVWIQYMARKYQSLVAGDGQLFSYPSYREEMLKSVDQLNSPDYEADAAYWKEKINAKPERWLQKKQHKSIAERKSITYILNLTEEQRAQLESLQLLTKAGLQQLTIAALLIYLGKTTGHQEFIFGIPIHKRNAKKLRSIVGTFTGVLPFKGQYNPGRTLSDFLKDISAAQRNDYRHQNYLVGDLSRHLRIGSAEGYLSDVIINYEPLNFDLDFGAGIHTTIARLTNEDERNPLKIVWRDYNTEQPLQLHIHYSNEYFGQAEIELLAQRLLFMLGQFADSLEREIESINILPAAEIALLKQFNNSFVAYPQGKTIIDLFAAQVLATPDSNAVVFGETKLSYHQLNQRSNQLARYLIDSGVKQEALVAVCIERSVEMIVAVFGILKAGAAYMPIDPYYPPERIGYMLENSVAAIIISSKQSREKLPPAGNVGIIELDSQWPETSGHRDDDLQIKINSHQLAYVIYTSGSTGKPKGVMIEHSGVVNLALSQAEALRLKAGTKTLQFASCGFDASCYEIFNTLLSGGCLVLCTKQDLLSAEGFEKLINQHQVELAVLPSSYQYIAIDHLGTLRTIVSAGEPLNEAIGKQIQAKGIRLINAYGPTETTVCATLTDNPIQEGHTIVIGKPVANLQVYILDQQNDLAPIGTTGELCVAGVQVARGYLNRPELTAEKFIANPFIRGEKLYKTGDLGRWLPNGNIEYGGRIDDQVKIRGHRIEPGEIETVLEQNEGVQQAAVIAKEDAEGNKRLVAYVVAKDTFDKAELIAYLQDKLPDYMVPALWVPLQNMPVTPSGKIDRKALPDLDVAATLNTEFATPRNEFEEQLAAIWQDLLDIDQVGIHDSFFELGGDSIITIQLVSKARRLGYELEVGDVFTYQTIAGLSKAMADRQVTDNTGDQAMLAGPCGLLPIQHWYLQKAQPVISHYNQSIIIKIDKAVTEQMLTAAIEIIVAHHDALRFQYHQNEGNWHQEYGTAKGNIIIEDIRFKVNASPAVLIAKTETAHQTSLDITYGELVRAVWIQTPEAEVNNRLLIIIHHLATDGVSWRILLEDLALILNDLIDGKKAVLPSKTSSYRQWFEALGTYSKSRRLQSQKSYWQQVVNSYTPLVVNEGSCEVVRVKDTGKHAVQLTQSQTRNLLQDVPKKYGTGINDLLVAALAKTICEWQDTTTVVIGLEGHGREAIEPGTDTSRTVGWFTTLFPVMLKAEGDKGIEDWIKSVKEYLRQVPDRGLGYGVLKYFNKDEALQSKDPWDIVFNYLGQLDNVVKEGKWLKAAAQSAGDAVSGEHIVDEKLSIDSMVRDGALTINFTYSNKRFNEETIAALAESYLLNLDSIITHCLQSRDSAVVHTPSDFGLATQISYPELDAFLDKKTDCISNRDSIQTIYALSGLQRGILFHGLYDRGVAGTYISQFGCDLQNVDIEKFTQAWEAVMAKHNVLRTAFYYDEFKVPVQCVYRSVALPIAMLDYTNKNEAEQTIAIKDFEKSDRLQGFDFKTAPLMRFALIRVADNAYRMLWTWHHILLDGWSLPILIQEFLSNYDLLIEGEKIAVREDNSYEKFIHYIEGADKEVAAEYWQQYLQPLEEHTRLPFVEIKPDMDERTGQNKLIFLTINKTESAGIKRFAQSNHVTINTVMQGVLAFMLHAYTGKNNIAYGVTVSGRPDALEDVETGVGMYINTLPLYSHLQPDEEIVTWLHRLQNEQLASRQFQHTPLFDIQTNGTLSGDLFDTLLVFENYPVSKLLSEGNWGLQIKNYRVHDQSNFPLTIAVNDAAEIFIQFSYNSGIIHDAYIDKLRSHFHQVLLQITGNQKTRLVEIELLTSNDKQQLLIDFNNTAKDYPTEKTIIDLFEAQVAATSGGLALLFEEEQLTFQQLNERANQLAKYLTIKGVKRGELIPVCMDRSPDLIIAILSILKAGAAFVPIDPEYPQERIDYILNDTKASVVITSTIGKEKFYDTDIELIDLDEDESMISLYSSGNLLTPITPDDLAYIIYTSGSTGKPKGVMVPHKGNVNMSLDQMKQFNITAADRVLQFASISFDASVSEIFMAFYAGASLVMMRKEMIQDGPNFAANLKAAGVSVVTLPPVYLQALNRDELKFLRVIITAGEAAVVETAAHLSNHVDYYNAYGPTECAVCVSIYKVQPQDAQLSRIPIGKPIANTRVFILDNELKLSPIGVPGEMYVAGVGLAKGYLNLPELTAEKFIISPFDANTILYKTGDTGKWLPDGNIEFLGRQDDQIKLRGYRIELGEIEATLSKHKDIDKSVAVVNEAKDDKQLIVYFQPKEKIRLWPSVAEFYVYDDLLYKTMAGDDARNAKYRNALRKVVKGKVVLEIGPGFEAILSRICIEEGAAKVYAVELLEDSYLKAKQTVADLGLTDKIIVIHDDITKVQLPELADLCVSEIVGAIGGAEGSAMLINKSRHLLKDPACMIPARSLTKIAAVTLPEDEFDCSFETLGAYYTTKIFEQTGHKFDLRVYLSAFPTRNIISNNDVFEDLDYTNEVKLEDEHIIHLKIEKTAVLHGFIVWLNLYCDAEELIDTLHGKYTWLPVYLPAFFNGEPVEPGDYIQAKVTRKLSANQLNPDFFISGMLVRQGEAVLPFTYESLNCSDTYQGNDFYTKIFENDEIKIAGTINKDTLREFLKLQLPEYMVPSMFIEVEKFPLTISGKIDKKALPLPDADEQLAGQFIAPQTGMEKDLAQIWKEVLEIDQVGIRDNFFELGGHSLLAIRLISVIREQLNIEVAIANIFDHPTIEALARELDAKTDAAISPSIQLQTRPANIPLSFGQERLWFIHQLEGSLEYHSPAALRLTGKLNVAALEQSLATIVDRHEVLRTVFNEIDGKPYQFIKDRGNWHLTVADGSKYISNSVELKDAIEEFVRKPFDLSTDFMLRATLIRLSDEDHVLVVVMHHIAADAWSMPIIVNELAELYRSFIEGRQAQLPALPLQYADFAIWQRDYLTADILAEKISYWKNKLDGVQPLQLPADFERPAVRSTNGNNVPFEIDKALLGQLHNLSRQQGATLFMTMLAAFKVLLYRYTGQQDISVGTSIANRTRQETEGLIGFFVNTLCFRDEVKGSDVFTNLLQQVRTTTLDAYAHQEVPFEKVVEAVVKERDAANSPLFQVMLVLQNTPDVPELTLGPLSISPEPYQFANVKFDLTFFLAETPQGLQGSVVYSTDLFSRHRIERMIAHFTMLLHSVVAAPANIVSSLQMLSEAEENQSKQGFNVSRISQLEVETVVAMFEKQAVRWPQSAALSFEGEEVSYSELNERANRLAHYLRNSGVKEDSLVPIFIERGPDMISGILGILKAGGAYVPIDTGLPVERISFIIQDTAATVIVCSKESSEKLPNLSIELIEIDGPVLSDQPRQNLNIQLTAHNLAYVIYTSGSTGQPKGVMVTHDNLTDYVQGLDERTGINSCNSFALVSTIATDLGNTVLFPSLISGGTLHLFSREAVSNIEYLHEYFKENDIDCVKIVPSHWKALMMDGKPLLPRRLLVFGGESLQAEQVALIRQAKRKCRVVNHYGPTETTVGKLLYEVDFSKEYTGTIPIGKPFGDSRIFVLNNDLSLCPAGVPGQLFIGGAGVAKGYLNNEKLTGEKFIADPFDAAANSPLYKTGDLVKYNADGNILFLGRIDDQVKIRGYRVEPGEVERVLSQSGQVSQAVVITVDDKQGNKRLVAYVVAENFDREALNIYLKEKLPDYMIPSVIVALNNLPLTANGKVDRKKLPDPESINEKKYESETAATETEAKLAEIWKDVLELDHVGLHDDFFELGGHSLLAVRLVSAIRKAFSVEMPIGNVFDFPTISLLAAQLPATESSNTLPVVEVVSPRPEHIPLSFSQERLWFIDRLEGSIQYHVPAVLQLKGALNTAALSKSLQQIIRRHEVLRTVVLNNEGTPYQFVKSEEDWKLEMVDGSLYAADATGLRQYIETLLSKPFELSTDYMLRAHLIRFAVDDHTLVLTLHHIASDGWSRPVLVRELVELYSAYAEDRKADLKELPVQYADYTIWQRNYLQGQVLENKLNYWKNKLDGAPALELPTDFVRPAVWKSQGALHRFIIDNELAGQIHEFGHRHSATLYMTLLTAFNVLLYRYSGQPDISVGTGIAGRQQHELEGLIGFFVNTLVMRSTVDCDASFTTLLQQIKATTLEAYAHQEVPFEKVVDAVIRERDISRNPLFQVSFVVQNTPDVPVLKLGDTAFSVNEYEHVTSKFDITFSISEVENGLVGHIEFSTHLYTEATIRRMATHFTELLRSAIKMPDEKVGRLPLLTAAEQQKLVSEMAAPVATYPAEKNIIQLFEKQVAKTPDATALLFDKRQISYSLLNALANDVALRLQQKGVQAETLVTICIERGIGMIAGILGVLKAGCAYVPIDPEYPKERIRFILEDTGAGIAVSSAESRSKLANAVNVEIIELNGEIIDATATSFKLPNQIQPTSLAYIIYTSGSTGKPKGVMIEHGSIVNLIHAQTVYFGINSQSRILQFSNYCFDASVEQLFLALFNGATLVLFPEGLQYNIALFEKFLVEERVDHLHATPFFLENINPNQPYSLKRVIAGGDLCRKELAAKWKGKAQFYNEYGPTETTVTAIEYGPTETTVTAIEYGDDGSNGNNSTVPIGKPLPNVSVYILDKNGTLCPLGIPGELYVGGVQVARGYLNRAELTAERFISNKFSNAPGARLYRTGDQARWLPDGNMEFLGRIDEQVKLRGYRIELGEIESVLNELQPVENSCVVVKKEDETAGRLVAYYIPEQAMLRQKEHQLYNEQINGWKEIHENEYVLATEEIADPEFNILGWNDSFTRHPIPAAHMREWLDDITDVIMSQNPQHVLEIGCGTGLIYYQLAGKLKKYIGTDFSRNSISQIRERISQGLRDYGPTELQVGAAHEITLRENEPVDTIILNSVVQYFPGGDYLNTVIEKSIALLNGKGCIIIGDVRDNRLLQLFKSRLHTQKVPGAVSIKDFNWAVEQEVLKEEELCFSPEYFYGLQNLYPQITHVHIQWKQGNYENELTMYRFTVIIHVGQQKELLQPEWLYWNGVSDVAGINKKLESSVDVIALENVPNPRLWKDRLLNTALQNPSAISVNDLLQTMKTEAEETAQVREILAAAEAKGYRYRLLPNKDPLTVNVLLELHPADYFISNAYQYKNTGNKVNTNIPLFNDIIFLLQKDIRSLLLEKLPEYMVPSEFIALTHLPATLNGKLDRQFLSRSEDKITNDRLNYQPPRNDTEMVLANIWQELLHIEQAGIFDNFFELGGHSLMGMRVISAIRTKLNREVSIKDLFIHPTIAELAGHLLSLRKGLLLPAITKQPRPQHIPLSFSQERLWFIDQLNGSVQYHIPSVIRLKGQVNKKELQHTLQEILQRHEVLRTVLREKDGQGYQYLLEKENWQLDGIDGLVYQQSPDEFLLYLQELIDQPFDLSKDYMLRAHLIVLSPDEHLLIITMHHIASDAWSMPIIIKEVAELYSAFVENRPAQLPALSIQYADYSIWQRTFLQGEILDSKIRYWKKKLDGVAPLQLPVDFTRPAVWSSRGSVVRFSLDKKLFTALKVLSHKQESTLFMTLLAAFNVLLHRYSNQEDICVGTSVANRNQKEVEELIGFFVNMLALRSRVSDELSFTDLLQQVKATTLEAYECGEVPFEKVVDAVITERDMSKNPLIQVMLILLNTPESPDLQLDELVLSIEPPEHTKTLFDISFYISETGNELQGWVVYATDLYSERTITQMIGNFQELLANIVATPEEKVGLLPMLQEAEKQQLLAEFNNTAADYPKEKTIVNLINEQVQRTPEAVAVVFEAEQLTYQQLHEKSNQLAHYLKEKGVQHETFVPICIERSIEMIIGILGILKASGIYVPIDPAYPAERINYMLEDTAATFILSSKKSKTQLPQTAAYNIISLDEINLSAQPVTDLLQSEVSPASLAYVIYTSGSTGKPKGVMVEHRNVVRLFKIDMPIYDFSEQDVWAMFHSFCFDFSVWEMYGALLFGGRLVVVPSDVTKDVSLFADLIIKEGVTVLNQTPSAFYNLQSLFTDQALTTSIRYVIFGGEALLPAKLQPWKKAYPSCRLVNMYGITETTVHVTFQELEQDHLTSAGSMIGKPIPTLKIYILDPYLNPVPKGLAGEIYVAGAGLARGYLNLPELTAQKFIADPFDTEPGSRMYKTGDLGRWVNGSIEYGGRIDEQVKIRGYRIELGEIESVLQQSGLANGAIVVTKENANGNKRLVGYTVAGNGFDKKAVTAYLKDKLPEYMVPALWIELEALPLTSNGKVDKKALPDIDAVEQNSSGYTPPRSQTEVDLAQVWQEILQIESVGIDDNFFELGGDSIITIQVISRLKRLGYSFQPKDIFVHQTIRNLSAIGTGTESIAEQGILTDKAGLLPIQQWYFEKDRHDVSHFNQSVLLKIDKSITAVQLNKAVELLTAHHDALRFKYYQNDGQWQQEYESDTAELITENLQASSGALSALITEHSEKYQRSLDIEKGELIRIVLIQTPPTEIENRLLVIIHHLAIDGVSWRILLSDLELLLNEGSLQTKTSSYRQWYEALCSYGQSQPLLAQKSYWQQAVQNYSPLSTDFKFSKEIQVKDTALFTVRLHPAQTQSLLQEVPRVYHTEINDILLSALAATLCNWSGKDKIVIGLEGHGREHISDEINTTRTVGWFTSLYPVLLEGGTGKGIDSLIKGVKEQLRQLPDKGLGYGVLKYINKEEALQGAEHWDVVFNYLGQLDNVMSESGWFKPAAESAGSGRSEEQLISEKLSVNSYVRAGELILNWSYSTKHYREDTIKKIATDYLNQLQLLIAHCLNQGKNGTVYTPSDYGLGKDVTFEELDEFLEEENQDNILSF